MRSNTNMKLIILILVLFSSASFGIDSNKVMGPDECAECHDIENNIWEGTHHFTTFESMPEEDDALSIAEKLGIDDVIESEICQSCHLTLQTEDDETEVIAGVSCESCHGAATDWMEIHSEEDKTPEQAKKLWAQSEAAGMIRPGNLRKLAGNCLDCHLVKNEKLVNVGGHTAGSEFNLISWSQGEIRHNTFHSQEGENRPATPAKQRKMLVIGSSLELQRSILAYSVAKDPQGEYAKKMLERINKTKKQLTDITATNASPHFKGLQALVSQAPASDLAGNKSIAQQIDTLIVKMQAEDSDKWQALDAIIKNLGPNKGDVQE